MSRTLWNPVSNKDFTLPSPFFIPVFHPEERRYTASVREPQLVASADLPGEKGRGGSFREADNDVPWIPSSHANNAISSWLAWIEEVALGNSFKTMPRRIMAYKWDSVVVCASEKKILRNKFNDFVFLSWYLFRNDLRNATSVRSWEKLKHD